MAAGLMPRMARRRSGWSPLGLTLREINPGWNRVTRNVGGRLRARENGETGRRGQNRRVRSPAFLGARHPPRGGNLGTAGVFTSCRLCTIKPLENQGAFTGGGDDLPHQQAPPRLAARAKCQISVKLGSKKRALFGPDQIAMLNAN